MKTLMNLLTFYKLNHTSTTKIFSAISLNYKKKLLKTS